MSPPQLVGRPAPGLPALLVLTDRVQARRPLRDVVAAAVDGGARAVVLREKDLPSPQRRQLADSLAALLAPVQGALLVAGGDLLGAPAQGLHLAAGDRYRAPRLERLGHRALEAPSLREGLRAVGQDEQPRLRHRSARPSSGVDACACQRRGMRPAPRAR